MHRRTIGLFAALVVSVLGLPTQAQDWPNRPIRWIVPFPPGGSTDIAVRPLADALSKALGQPVIVENKTGASGNIGTDFVAKSAPDGYTVLAAIDSIAIAPHVDPKLSYEPLKDFMPITQLTRQPVVLAVHPLIGVSSVAELVELAKKKPGLAYATSGAGTQQHLAAEWFGKLAGVQLTHIPYRGGAPAVADLVSGQVTIGSLGSSPVLPHFRAGRLKILAQTTVKRSPSLEDVPTYGEAGYRDLIVDQWLGVMLPARTPEPIAVRLHAEIIKALADPAIRGIYAKAALEPVGNSRAEFTAVLKTNYDTYGRLVRELNIKVE